jgi:hypothetical protein
MNSRIGACVSPFLKTGIFKNNNKDITHAPPLIPPKGGRKIKGIRRFLLSIQNSIFFLSLKYLENIT